MARSRARIPALVAAALALLPAGPGRAAPAPKHLPAKHLSAKHLAPIPGPTLALMAARGTAPGAPILMRAFKKEAEIEVWTRGADGRFAHLKTFPICRWSGQLGPKRRSGDRQAPEGFYSIRPAQMNPNSRYYLSFDVGYPNAYDRAHGGTGSALMVHGTCSSAGCFAMTDAQVGEIFALAREAFAGGQAAFQFQAYPFRMSAAALARHRLDPNIDFWRQLKEGADRFEATGREPLVTVAGGRYAFAPYPDPAVEAAAQAHYAAEEARLGDLVARGIEAVRTTYADGGQHPVFAALLRRGAPLGEVSRPEALAFAGHEVVTIPAHRVRLAAPPPPAPVLIPLPVIATEPSLFARTPLAEGATRLSLALPAPAGRPLLVGAPRLGAEPTRFDPLRADPGWLAAAQGARAQERLSALP
ncbi:L,D-transpeptidase family protein [Methylobacterium sp. WSM2598]|uniref:L,D-transpeptidase family protein n=1 Tax=Methylobacterium sp. WSM2598 TaxID=398261 RepID=UPI0003669B70|nr:murein L,D-transpeptidase family protein [Methylobacterium sp. WSM2598]